MRELFTAIAPVSGILGLLWALAVPIVASRRFRLLDSGTRDSVSIWILRGLAQECIAALAIDFAVHYLTRSTVVSDVSQLALYILLLLTIALSTLASSLERRMLERLGRMADQVPRRGFSGLGQPPEPRFHRREDIPECAEGTGVEP